MNPRENRAFSQPTRAELDADTLGNLASHAAHVHRNFDGHILMMSTSTAESAVAEAAALVNRAVGVLMKAKAELEQWGE